MRNANLKKYQQNNVTTANSTTHTEQGEHSMNNQTLLQQPVMATRIFITCLNPMKKGLSQERVESILKQWDITYYIFIYGIYSDGLKISESGSNAYLQVYVELKNRVNPKQLTAALMAEQYEIPHPDCLSTTMRDWITKTGFCTPYAHFEQPDSLPVEYGICPGDVAPLSQYWEDFAEIIELVKMGYPDHIIVREYPSATTHLYAINAYREHYLSNPDHYYDYLTKEPHEND